MDRRDIDRAMSFEGIAVPTSALEQAELFEGLGPAELQGVAAVMRFRSFEAGQVICREGEQGESMFVIVDGLVHLLRSLSEMPDVRTRSIFDEGRLVGKLRSGEVVGTGSLLTGEPRSATATAAVATDLLELGREDFGALVGRFPRVLENLTRILTRRLAEATAGQARATRGEAVALITGRSYEGAVPDVLAAAAAASPRSVESLDARNSLADALDPLDRMLREHATVAVVARLDREQLSQLLRQVDRSVAIVGDQAEARMLAELAAEYGVRGQALEVALGVGVEPEALSTPGGATDAVRVVRSMRGRDAAAPAADDVAWLGRHLARTKLGLALGAGGAKGYAHVGALHVLEEAGYRVDCVSGSSIGAIVGTWVALGMTAAEIETAMRETFTPERVAETLKISLSGQASGYEAMLELLREISGGRTFEDCTIPLTIMAADLTDRVPAPFRKGPIDEALIAATALAGVFPPHELSGHRLVDGLAIDPTPTAAVIEDGADVTVSVNLIPRETLPAWPGQEPPPAKEAARRGSRMLDTLLEVMDLAQLDTSERGAALADVVVTPRFGPGSWRDFQLADLFLAAGREAIEEQLPALRSLAKPQFAGVTN
jgi:predicted acylesterase/phospholipase RssA/CRP-like cAMP-binding protein